MSQPVSPGSGPVGVPATATGPVAAPVPVGATVPETDERTRDRVLSAVLEHGPVSAAQLGALLGLTPAAVRRHLDTLFRHGVIEVKLLNNPRSGAGRPARRYVVSKQGQTELGDDYLGIARLALGELARTNGQASVAAFAGARFASMEADYQPLADAAGPDVAARSKALAAALTADRFVASSRTVNPTSALAAEQLCQAHCPIQELAATFPEFCDAETEVFSRLLGVDVRRLSTLASGGHVCTTHVPTGRAVVRRRGEGHGSSSPPAAGSAAPEISTHQQERP